MSLYALTQDDYLSLKKKSTLEHLRNVEAIDL